MGMNILAVQQQNLERLRMTRALDNLRDETCSLHDERPFANCVHPRTTWLCSHALGAIGELLIAPVDDENS